MQRYAFAFFRERWPGLTDSQIVARLAELPPDERTKLGEEVLARKVAEGMQRALAGKRGAP